MSRRYVLHELRRHHHRTLVNILGIAVGISLFVSINAVSEGFRKAVSLPFENIGADLVVQKPEQREVDAAQTPASMEGIRLPFSNGLLTQEEIRNLASIESVAGSASSLLLWEFAPGGFRTVLGIDPAQADLGPVKVREWLAEGRYLSKEGEAILEKHFAKFQHLRPGDSVIVGKRPLTVVGLLSIKEGAQISAANIYVSIADARKLSGSGPSGANVVYLRLKDPSLQDEVKAQIASRLRGMSVTSSDSFLELMGGVSKISKQFALILSLIALAVAVSLVVKSMLANLISRSGEIGILKAVGWTGKDIRNQLLGEALLQSLAGGLLGLFVGYAVAWVSGFISISASAPWQTNLLPAFAKNMEIPQTTAVHLPVSVSGGLVAASLAISLVSGVAASYFMGKRTDRMKPSEIFRRL